MKIKLEYIFISEIMKRGGVYQATTPKHSSKELSLASMKRTPLILLANELQQHFIVTERVKNCWNQQKYLW